MPPVLARDVWAFVPVEALKAIANVQPTEVAPMLAASALFDMGIVDEPDAPQSTQKG